MGDRSVKDIITPAKSGKGVQKEKVVVKEIGSS
jgi:hypothetical protein